MLRATEGASLRSLPGGWPRSLAAVWRALSHPLPLLGVAVPVALYLLAGWILPQMPGQYVGNPTQATRWLLEIESQYPGWGRLLAGLGLFNVLHSPVFRLLMAALTLLLLVQVGDSLAVWQRARLLKARLPTETGKAGEALPVPGPGPIHRRRWIQPGDTETLAASASRCLDVLAASTGRLARFLEIQRAQIDRERRWLIQFADWTALARGVTPAGLVLALAGLWMGINLGWSVQATDLAPGEEVRFPRWGVNVRLPLSGPGNADPSGLPVEVELDGTQATLVGPGPLRAQVDGADVTIRPGSPGLLLATTDGQPRLALPGSGQTTAQMAFVFPGVADEQVVLLPEVGVGVRMVRLDTETPSFLVEIVDGASLEVLDRQQVSESARVPVQRPGGGPAVYLQITPVAGVNVFVSHWPGQVWVWVGLVLALVGLVGVWIRPFFVLLQLSPWPGEHGVWVAQSDRAERLVGLVECLQAHPPGEA